MEQKKLIELLSKIVQVQMKKNMVPILKEALSDPSIKRLLKEEIKVGVETLLSAIETQISGDTVSENVTKVQNQHGFNLQDAVNSGGKPKPTVKQEDVPLSSFVRNSKLNEMLNITAYEMRTGLVAPPMSDPGGQMTMAGMNAMSRPTFQPEGPSWMPPNAASVSPPPLRPDDNARPLTSMLPSVDVNGNPLMVNPNAMPVGLQRALTRDYSKLMKKVNGKERIS